MFRSVKIKGFRGFNDFSLNGLGRVNLLVGKNNSGKSSVLEALYIYASAGDAESLLSTLSRRSEQFFVENESNRRSLTEYDVSNLFNGRSLNLEAKFSISTENDSFDGITCSIIHLNSQENPNLFLNIEDVPGKLFMNSFGIKLEGERIKSTFIVPLTRRNGLRQDSPYRFESDNNSNKIIDVKFVSTNSLSGKELTEAWAGMIFTSYEDAVINALKVLESRIERIAILPQQIINSRSRGGFLLKLAGEEKGIPIGSFGDGTWRLLALAVSVAQAKNGILLVDEIDTGLHHSAMQSMWKLIYKVAKDQNVQVFATTHSNDCVISLASVLDDEALENNNVTIQRIDPNETESIAYTSKQIKIAAEQDIEVR